MALESAPATSLRQSPNAYGSALTIRTLMFLELCYSSRFRIRINRPLCARSSGHMHFSVQQFIIKFVF
ncbi:hypothetical protein FIBSPDRAFT_846223 [Athelia psychrophila]|uniref:Uncharacterized protein n=1 Tax=Athelia psychrophila TaxID=1759441 RepID=A0A166HDT3_9AGAM|nr:hypothetical protein FIBSPDRAFT_863550 [Fibularhizoctonia sp. CBS 109695]KZP34127.1 hypothetical protein FIBSPDRAFT_846223 [Fibularhizoctonia sp. CBS 109695]